MDNLTHSLAGWALGQTGLKRKTRKGLAALILGANMPDVDVFFGWVPWAPLATHRGFTHGLVGGVLLMPPVLAWLLWQLDRWQQRRGETFPSDLPMHVGWLVALSYIGAISHPLLDWQNAYAVQLLSPFDERWFHTDALFIIDLWVWFTLGLAVWLSMRREAREADTWRRPPIAGLILLVGYITANAALSARAKQVVQERPAGARPDVIVAAPPPVWFWRRDLVWREGGAIARGVFDPVRSMSGLTAATSPKPDGMDDPLARQALTATSEIVDFMRWSILPVAHVEREGCRERVSYNDARFADGLSAARFWISATVSTGGPGCGVTRARS